jgi:uncharacterized protein YdhG (YjbR/CyaY superfamily)
MIDLYSKSITEIVYSKKEVKVNIKPKAFWNPVE